MTGSLNGVPFSNATYVITATGDSAAVQSGTWGGAVPIYTLPVSPTLALSSSGTEFARVSLLPLSGKQWTVDSMDLTLLYYPGFGLNTFAVDPSQITGIVFGFGVAAPSFFNDLQSVASYSPGLNAVTTTVDVGAPYQTSGGDLVISAYNNPVGGSFTITADPAAVPEIDPAGMGSVLAFVAGALGLFERRRLKVA